MRSSRMSNCDAMGGVWRWGVEGTGKQPKSGVQHCNLFVCYVQMHGDCCSSRNASVKLRNRTVQLIVSAVRMIVILYEETLKVQTTCRER
jgi:hypothetical protein